MRKVLIVDDNSVVSKLVSLYLDDLGCIVRECSNPLEVLARVMEFRPDVVLLDITMKGLRGGGLNDFFLRRRDGEITAKVILFSSKEEKLQREMLDVGLVDGYYIKDNPVEGLKEMIDRYTNQEMAL